MLKCPACGNSNNEVDEFCADCGTELRQPKDTVESISSSEITPKPPSVKPASEPIPTVSIAGITLKRNGVLTAESFPIQGERIVIGRFDIDSGPVDIDLGKLPPTEADYISRHHAEIWRAPSGQWFIKDLGTKNGSFFRGKGQAKWERINGEQAINQGEEIALGNVKFEFQVG